MGLLVLVAAFFVAWLVAWVYFRILPRCSYLDCYKTFCKYRDNWSYLFYPKMTYEQMLKVVDVKELKPMFCYALAANPDRYLRNVEYDHVSVEYMRHNYFVYWSISDKNLDRLMLNPKSYFDYYKMCKYTEEKEKGKSKTKCDEAQLRNLKELQKTVQEIREAEDKKVHDAVTNSSNVLKRYTRERTLIEIEKLGKDYNAQ